MALLINPHKEIDKIILMDGTEIQLETIYPSYATYHNVSNEFEIHLLIPPHEYKKMLRSEPGEKNEP